MRKQFHFNTGVQRYKHSPPVPLMPGYVDRGGTMQIPFECDNVPDGAVLVSLSDSAESYAYDPTVITVPVVQPSLMLSRYAHFRVYKPIN